MTNDLSRLKSTVRRPESPPRREPDLGCTSPHITNEKSWGEETAEGYRAAKVTSGVKDRPLTSWYALDHGCAKVKSSMGFETGEASELRLVTLIPGEPSDLLFDVPPDYQEGPPSALAGPANFVQMRPPVSRILETTGCGVLQTPPVNEYDKVQVSHLHPPHSPSSPTPLTPPPPPHPPPPPPPLFSSSPPPFPLLSPSPSPLLLSPPCSFFCPLPPSTSPP